MPRRTFARAARRLTAAGLLVLCLAPKARGEEDYVLERLEAPAYVWAPWAGAWEKAIKGMQLPSGTLVQSLEGGTLRFRRRSEERGKDASYTLRLKAPMLFRLTPELTRRLQSEALEVDADEVAGARRGGKMTKPHWLELERAWIRQQGVDMFLSDLKELALASLKPLSLAAQARGHLLEARNLMHEIRVVNPENGSIAVTGASRTPLLVVWDGLKAGVPVSVFIWRRGQTRGEPIGTTNGRAFELPPLSPGGYYIQVASDAGDAQSRPVYVVVE